jgi:hypothetical protein
LTVLWEGPGRTLVLSANLGDILLGLGLLEGLSRLEDRHQQLRVVGLVRLADLGTLERQLYVRLPLLTAQPSGRERTMYSARGKGSSSDLNAPLTRPLHSLAQLACRSSFPRTVSGWTCCCQRRKRRLSSPRSTANDDGSSNRSKCVGGASEAGGGRKAAQEGHLASSEAGSGAPHEEQVVREVVELEGRSARTSDGCSPDLTTRCELGPAIRRFMVVVQLRLADDLDER